MADVVTGQGAESPPFPEPSVQRFAIRILGLALFAYMAYATIYGPYKTTVVHLAIFAAAMLCISFLGRSRSTDPLRRYIQLGWDMVAAAAAVASMAYVVFDYERLLNLWGSSYLTKTDVVVGLIMVLVALEGARRQSIMLALLGVLSAAYMLFGNSLPGVFSHAGMDIQRFAYVVSYTSEGLFGTGLKVAANYLFMFMMFGAVLQATKTGDFIIKLANCGFGRQTGGAAKGAMAASAGLGTMVGSSVGNVVATGAFTIPLMIRTGFRRHIAAAVETNTSEGAQLVPPIMGASAFIMAQITGISYGTIALAAVIPAFLYYFSLYWVIHIEALKNDLRGLPESEMEPIGQVLAEGWHLLIAPVVLFYLLVFQAYTAAFASFIALIIAILIGASRKVTRVSLRTLLDSLNDGVRQAAAITALIISIGLLQAAIVATGLGPRLTEIILNISDGSLIVTALLAVVAATLLGMGMPTPIAYLMLAMFAAPAIITAGAPVLGTHLFLFYFAIKSGSTPPVALVAVVAAGIARANWWSTSVAAFVHSLPGFIVAFMFLYSGALLMQGDVISIVMAALTASVGVFAMAAGIQGWCVDWISWIERLALIAAALSLIKSGGLTDSVGLAVVAGIAAFRWMRKSDTKLSPNLSE
jgi:TRAP transporter 4TM/12TM fusion protein